MGLTGAFETGLIALFALIALIALIALRQMKTNNFVHSVSSILKQFSAIRGGWGTWFAGSEDPNTQKVTLSGSAFTAFF